ncbi:MAG TPA: PAS domain S-box protein [Opitutaceae bacterium]|nr:PAS domain S-box protein [Opitutaceae bacterium]
MINPDGKKSPPLSAVQARLSAIVESSDDAIISKTLDGIIETWNRGAERIFGYTAAEMIGRPLSVLIPADRKEEEVKILERLRAGEHLDHFETVRQRKNGEQIHVSVTISPMRDEKGKIFGVSKIARDISMQKQLEIELRKAKDAAEDASKAKNLFISILSHELRTPLTPALAILSSLESAPDLAPEAREQIKMARRNIETEAGLVDDLLDLTRVSGGKVTLHFESVNAHEALRQCLAGVQRGIDEKGISVTFDLRAKNYFVWADPRRLQQVFFNLLSNAVKFTPSRGAITLRSRDAGDNVRIQIADSGEGIEPAMLPKIFRAFEQAPESRRFGGLGLGLSIVKSLLAMHGGTVVAESQGRGQGSIFTVEMVTTENPESTKTKGRRGDQLPVTYRLLLVEDHADTLSALTTLLKRKGYTVTPAASVAEALLAAESENFDLLLSDMGLPDGSGSDIMKYLKTRGNVRGIALTGFGQDEDITSARAAGFDTHITKPIKIQVLHETILKTMAARTGQVAGSK